MVQVPGGIQALLSANVTGAFFGPTKSLYFGGYPIHFAVCSNDTEIFDTILSFASVIAQPYRVIHDLEEAAVDRSNTPLRSSAAKEISVSSKSRPRPPSLDLKNRRREEPEYIPPTSLRGLYRCDDYGNNVLHFCVIHGLNNMYIHVRNTASRLIMKELKMAVMKIFDHNEAVRLYNASIDDKNGLESEELLLSDRFFLERTFKKLDCERKLRCYPPDQLDIDIPEVDRDEIESIPESWYEKHVHRILDERLVHVLNCYFHSPVTLAADVTTKTRKAFNLSSNPVLLKMLLDEEFKLNWDYGPTKSVAIKLVGLEKPYDRHDYTLRPLPPTANLHGIIEWLCKSRFREALVIPVIETLISRKWKVVGLPHFKRRFALHAVFTIGMTIIAYYPYRVPFKDDAQHYLESVASTFVAIAFCCNVIICFINLLADAPAIWDQGLDWWGFHGGIRSAARLDRFAGSFHIGKVCYSTQYSGS